MQLTDRITIEAGKRGGREDILACLKFAANKERIELGTS
jgi:hypothetical protein